MANFSIVFSNIDRCCMSSGKYGRCQGRVERHHIMNGADRKKSDKYGLIAPLCSNHHRVGREAVHNNARNMNLLKAKAHIMFREHYPELNWLRIFGRNYAWIIEDKIEEVGANDLHSTNPN